MAGAISSSEIQEQLVGKIECSWWKFTIRSRNYSFGQSEAGNSNASGTGSVRVSPQGFFSILQLNFTRNILSIYKELGKNTEKRQGPALGVRFTGESIV